MKKNCLMCGGPIIEKKRGDTKFCTTSCKAKYWAKKNKKGLGGITSAKKEIPDLVKKNVLQTETPKKDELEKSPFLTADQIHMEPFDNLVEDSNDSKNAEGLSKENDTSEENNTYTNDSPAADSLPVPEKFITETTRSKSFLYGHLKNELALCQRDIKACESEMANLNQVIEQEKAKNGSGYLLLGAGLGIGAPLLYNHFQPESKALEPDGITDKNGKPVPYKIKKSKPVEDTKLGLGAILLLGALGTGIGAISQAITKDDREKKKQAALVEGQKVIVEYNEILSKFREREISLKSQLDDTPEYIVRTETKPNPAYDEYLKAKAKMEEEKKSAQEKKRLTSEQPNVDVKNEALTNNYSENFLGLDTNLNPEAETTDPLRKKDKYATDKIFSMDELGKRKIIRLDFNGKWEEFFGKPQPDFYCVLYGMSGQGKSNFAMQFGKYLAQRFGRVLYISGEEGFQASFLDKVEKLGAKVDRYYAVELHSGEEILSEVPNNFHFIIIDSVNNMGIEPEMMQAIRRKFPKSGIIAICQSTKKGEIRGSYQIVHDGNIQVRVHQGIATTEKNRFKAIGQTFDVFEVYDKPNGKPHKPNSDFPLDDAENLLK